MLLLLLFRQENVKSSKNVVQTIQRALTIIDFKFTNLNISRQSLPKNILYSILIFTKLDGFYHFFLWWVQKTKRILFAYIIRMYNLYKIKI